MAAYVQYKHHHPQNVLSSPFQPVLGRAEPKEKLLNTTYLFPHDIGGLHDAAGGQSVVTGQQDGLLQCHTEGGAAAREREKKPPLRSGSLCTPF